MATKVVGIECGYSSSVLEMPLIDKYDFQPGEDVIFRDAEDKEEYGAIKYIGRSAVDEGKILFTSRIVRRATPNDIQKVENHIEMARHALEQCKSILQKTELDMNIFRAGYSFDGTKVHFMFTSEDRVDFRDLVKELAKVLQKQIHLRQIGPRDKAKMIGGYGKCGRPLCCTTWMHDMESIGMEMVRAQALESKGSAKLSGTCGKLLCCLKYEVEAYRALRKSLPNLGAKVQVVSHGGPGTIIALDILNQKAKIVFEGGEIATVNRADIEKVLSTK